MKSNPLRYLTGKRLSIWRRAANMINLQFGEITVIEKGSIGEFGLHIQCPFRLLKGNKIITGNGDLYEPETEGKNFDWGKWYDEKSWNGNLMEAKIQKILKGYDKRTDSIINKTRKFKVASATRNSKGDFNISFDNNYIIELFVNGSSGEHYRVLDHEKKKHYVCES